MVGQAEIVVAAKGQQLAPIGRDLSITTPGDFIAASDLAVVLTREGRTIRVPLQAVMDDPKENVFLQAGDVVTFVRDPQTFTAMGATGRNSVVTFDTAALNLDEAIGKTGGLIDQQSDPDALFVIRYEPAATAAALTQARGVPAVGGYVPTVYHVNLKDPSGMFLARRFPMRNKDILYVANSPVIALQKVLTLVNLLTSPAVTAASVKSIAP